ncbi:MAG: type IV pilus modification protein PilV [Gallionella sp.]
MKKSTQIFNRQRGFSMMEVLVTLVIIAVALLGTAGLQAHALKTSKSSEFRNQAIFLSADIVERMEANKSAAVAGSYKRTAGVGTVSTTCDSAAVAPCNDAALASYDLDNWQAAVAQLPSGVGSITGAAGNPATYIVTISWAERAQAAVGQVGAVAETTTLTSTKIIRN